MQPARIATIFLRRMSIRRLHAMCCRHRITQSKVGSRLPPIQATGGTAAGQRPREELLVSRRHISNRHFGAAQSIFDPETLPRNPFFTWAFFAQFLSGSRV
jgi:hypothetical protein